MAALSKGVFFARCGGLWSRSFLVSFLLFGHFLPSGWRPITPTSKKWVTPCRPSPPASPGHRPIWTGHLESAHLRKQDGAHGRFHFRFSCRPHGDYPWGRRRVLRESDRHDHHETYRYDNAFPIDFACFTDSRSARGRDAKPDSGFGCRRHRSLRPHHVWQTLSIKENDYILALRSMRASHLRIIFNHILPNAFPAITVLMTLQLGQLILTEAVSEFPWHRH